MDTFHHVTTTRDFWRAFKKCSGSNSTIPSLLQPDGSFAVTEKAKAELLSDTLAASFNRNDCLPPVYNPEDKLIDVDWLCTPQFVAQELQNLKSSAPTGLDSVPVSVLKACAEQLAAPVADILNRALGEGQFPSDWKHARVTALPKRGYTSSPDNYRPISILPVLSKVAERWLVNFVTLYVSVSPHQFAQTKGRSTEDALAFLQFSVANGFEVCKGHSTKVAAVAFDVSKAFDSVPKYALLNKLQQRWNVPIPILRLVKDYLSNRSQTVCVDGVLSRSVSIESGVPQGSVVGGLLFCAYVDSVLSVKLSHGAATIMYADDLILLKPIPTIETEYQLQTDIDLIVEEYSQLFLQLNAKSLRFRSSPYRQYQPY